MTTTAAAYTITDADRWRIRDQINGTSSRATIPDPDRADRAYELALAMYQAAAQHGVSPEHLAMVASIPLGAWDVIPVAAREAARERSA